MRRSTRFLLPILLAAALAVTGCDSNDSDGDGGDTVNCDVSGDRVVTARVNGEAFCSPAAFASFLTDDDVTIRAPTPDAQQFLTLGFPAQEGIHNFSESVTGGSYTPRSTGIVTYEATEGMMTVSEASKTRTRGTFAFVATNPLDGTTVTITDGVFDVAID